MWVKNERYEFEMDDKFSYLVNLCSFRLMCNGYIRTYVNRANFHVFIKFGYKIGQHLYLHRILFELHIGRKLEIDELVDHKDMVKTNNKIENLRVVSHSENIKNRKLRMGQIYYNIYYDEHTNYFVFQHQERRVDRKFRTLHQALAFFLEYDKLNDYVLTKHIHDLEPMDGIENIVLTPDARCEECDLEYWCKNSLRRHQKIYHA